MLNQLIARNDSPDLSGLWVQILQNAFRLLLCFFVLLFILFGPIAHPDVSGGLTVSPDLSGLWVQILQNAFRLLLCFFVLLFILFGPIAHPDVSGG
ncbi:MAG: hypothetical protein HS118_00660 [Bacteroidia bacterium]|nr:hypothetical protein [Bacteroidia bacterium]